MPKPNRTLLAALEDFGRERLSEHFFMRDFLYSEVSAAHGIPNVPDDAELAVKAGKGLCENLLEPLRSIFGHVVIRSAFRSAVVNGYCHKHKMGCSSNKKNFAKHIWDHPDKGRIGATACIVIPWFINSHLYKENEDWRPLAWFIHDKLPYSRMVFFPKNAAFNLTWRDKSPERYIRAMFGPAPRILTKPGMPNHEGDHSEHYPGFPSYQSTEMNVEQIRNQYRPDRIRILFVGESPPASGKFFYNGNSQMARNVRKILGELLLGGTEDFFSKFKTSGCYLDDLVLVPVNKSSKSLRRQAKRNAIPDLAKRIEEYQPVVVVALLKSIERDVREAVAESGVDAQFHATHFPGNGQQGKFEMDIRRLLPVLKGALSG